MGLTWPLPGISPRLPPPDGRFGARRRYDVHTGIDLHCPEGSPVVAMEQGTVVAVPDFTGPEAGSPWWLQTRAIMVEGVSGVILYGEMTEAVRVGQTVLEGGLLGHVKRVLRNDKGRPTSMLHLEWHVQGTRLCADGWALDGEKPLSLLDPMGLLLLAGLHPDHVDPQGT